MKCGCHDEWDGRCMSAETEDRASKLVCPRTSEFRKRAQSLLVVVSSEPEGSYEYFTSRVRDYNSIKPFEFPLPAVFEKKFNKVSHPHHFCFLLVLSYYCFICVVWDWILILLIFVKFMYGVSKKMRLNTIWIILIFAKFNFINVKTLLNNNGLFE